eukprot:4205402-Amphidinium_carterae.1
MLGRCFSTKEIFTKKCRAVSECTSSLKGGDLAGDVGWLRLPEVGGLHRAMDVVVRTMTRWTKKRRSFQSHRPLLSELTLEWHAYCCHSEWHGTDTLCWYLNEIA